MGRPRAVLQLELQPVAQVHSELRSKGTRYQAQIIILLILLPGHATVPVERCAPGRLIPTQSIASHVSITSHASHDRVTCVDHIVCIARITGITCIDRIAYMNASIASRVSIISYASITSHTCVSHVSHALIALHA